MQVVSLQNGAILNLYLINVPQGNALKIVFIDHIHMVSGVRHHNDLAPH